MAKMNHETKEKAASARRSGRHKVSLANQAATTDPINAGILHMEKARDGHEEKRDKNSMQKKLRMEGPMAFETLPKGNKFDSVNDQRRKARSGVKPCYDVMDAQGLSICACSLPLTVMAGVLQGLKSADALTIFKKKNATLRSHTLTNCMFLHWQGGSETRSKGKSFKEHKFFQTRPDLVTCVESLGNTSSRKTLFHPKTGEMLHPGLLSNKLTGTSDNQDFQDPHWCFEGWRKIKAEELPWWSTFQSARRA
jgi:hypothetical protein